MPITTTQLGPGTLRFTDAAGLDFSCQVSKARVKWAKDKDDDVTMLCGDVKAGITTYTSQLTFTVDQDLSDPAGLVFFSWTNKGTQAGVEFVPNTAAGAAVTGTVVVDPIEVGGDEGGKDMTSDVTWDYVGTPVLAEVVGP